MGANGENGVMQQHVPDDVARMFTPILAQLRGDLAAQFGGPDLRLDPMTYEDRPFSHLLRIRATNGGRDRERRFFVKIVKANPDNGGVARMRRRVADDFRATGRIADAMAHHEDLAVVRPVACYVDDLVIVTEEVLGETLREYLDAHARWFPSQLATRDAEQTLSSVGRWLRAFQAVDPVTGPVSLPDLREYVDVRLRRLVERGVWTAAQRQGVLGHLMALESDVSRDELQEVLVHADLAPGNILVSPGRITVIDLAMVQRGTALHDISRLYLQLDALRAKPQFRPAMVTRLQTALLRGFDPALTAERPLFRFLVMLHRINHLGTLSLKRERFPGSLHSRRVLRVHRAWIEKELQQGAGRVVGQ